jgi:formylglycine-generating enzyme required for sulfatase activity
MASKHALLIGVSSYGEGLTPIPSARLDVEALAEVLRDPQLGGFPSDQVVVLHDPQRTPMEKAVAELFANRDSDDLLLLYFSGHGFRDNQRQLLLSCSESTKSKQGKPELYSTVRARDVQAYMQASNSQRQLLILDCCFSGAFADGMAAKDDGAIDLEAFGGKGKAVLTSSASIETSSAPEAGDGLSMYTRFLVEGISTGAADLRRRGFVDVKDLHNYVESRLQELAPAMSPQLIATGAGREIWLSRVPRDSRVDYRQKVEELAKRRRGVINKTGRMILQKMRANLLESEQISDEQAEQIEAEVLGPWREYAKKLAEFEALVAELVIEGQGLSALDWQDLRDLQAHVRLAEPDVEEILRRYGLDPVTILLSAEEIDRQLAEVAAQVKAKADAERLAREQEQAELKARDQEAQAHAKAKAEAERLAKEQVQKRKEPELQPLTVSTLQPLSVFTAVVVQGARQGLRGLLGPKWRIVKRTLQVQGYQERLADGVELSMVQIPAGSFLMGSPQDEGERLESEGPQHQVQLQGFFMAQTPITQAQWRVVAGWQKLQRDLNLDPSYFKGPNRPVEQVNWEDAIEFCNRLSQRTGRHYSLPSEAQWEYACRAGTTTPFHFGETISPELANYNADYTYGDGPKGLYRKETTEVAVFPANLWGLHDMHGNVWEWCLDQWHRNYGGGPTDGSAWVTMNVVMNDKRLLRGGSWSYFPGGCRSAYRDLHRPGFVGSNVGLRVVCLPQGCSS